MTMPPRYLTTTQLTKLHPLTLGGSTGSQPLLTEHARLQESLARGGSGLSTAFAEPVVGSLGQAGLPRNVAWYAALPQDAVPLTDLSGEERVEADAALRDLLGKIRPLLADPVAGPILARALVLPSLSSVWASEDRVVLTDWAVAPESLALQSADGLSEHVLSVFGGHWQGDASPLRQALSTRVVGVDESTGVASVNRVAKGAVVGAVVGAGMGGQIASGGLIENRVIEIDRPWWRRAWFVSFVGLSLLLLGLILGSLLLGDRLILAQARMDPAMVPGYQGVLDGLRMRRNALRQRLTMGDAACEGRAPEAALPPQLLPAPKSIASGTVAVDGSQTGVLAGADTASAPRDNLASYVEKSTVLVLAVNQGGGSSSGSGFLIDDRHVVTNRHVVEGLEQGGRLLVTSQTMGRLQTARVVTRSPNSDQGERDYAVLLLEQAVDIHPLTLTNQIGKTDEVISVGYPGDVLDWDRDYQALANGDVSAAPSTTLAPGAVMNLVTRQQVPLVFHSARISGGNSGGPLVDRCGRVVGINTLGNTAKQIQIALSATDLKAFLDQHGIVHGFDASVCDPDAD